MVGQCEDMAMEEVNELMAEVFGDPLLAHDALSMVTGEDPTTAPSRPLVLGHLGIDFSIYRSRVTPDQLESFVRRYG